MPRELPAVPQPSSRVEDGSQSTNFHIDGTINIQQPRNVVIHNNHHYHREVEAGALNPARIGNSNHDNDAPAFAEEMRQRFTQLDDAVAETRLEVAEVRAEMRYEMAEIRGGISETGMLVKKGPEGTASNPITVMSDAGSGVVERVSNWPFSRIHSVSPALDDDQSWLQPRGGTAVPNRWTSEGSPTERLIATNKRNWDKAIVNSIEGANGQASGWTMPGRKKRKTDNVEVKATAPATNNTSEWDSDGHDDRVWCTKNSLAAFVKRAMNSAAEEGEGKIAAELQTLHQQIIKDEYVRDLVQAVLNRTATIPRFQEAADYMSIFGLFKLRRFNQRKQRQGARSDFGRHLSDVYGIDASEAAKVAGLIKEANQAAIEDGHSDVAAVMDNIFQLSLKNHFMMNVLNAVLSKTATHGQMLLFKDYVRWAERALGLEEGKRLIGIRYETVERGCEVMEDSDGGVAIEPESD